MEIVDTVLSELADDTSVYERQGGTVLLTRQGREYSLTLKETPGVGIVVEGDMEGNKLTSLPFNIFIQKNLLELPRLSSQIIRTIDRISEKRPTKYIDGPAEIISDGVKNSWQDTSSQFKTYLNEQEAGTTRIIQLTASAGQGKTVLLEQIARESAYAYSPDIYPMPFLLSVDLLGRYVGNVDDAIAGSLNNTYNFPGLNQRDITLCIRNRWIILALDGFDELVARVGARDAFIRITELLDQLRGSGTIILSARETFFELYQITTAIRSYLQPRQGSYNTSVIRLLPWLHKEGEKVFISLGSEKPKDDLSNLLRAFGEDSEIVLQPFFLTRLANLWNRGERFDSAVVKKDKRWRTEYIIQTYIDRESGQKWVDREGKPFLSVADHTTLLSGISEEMWRTGIFKLSKEELQIATEIALSNLAIPAVIVERVLERIPTHAALTARDRGFSFIHDRFFNYYLAIRFKDIVVKGDLNSLRSILELRELWPDMLSWVDWLLSDFEERKLAITNILKLIAFKTNIKALEANIATVLGMLLNNSKDSYQLDKLIFIGDALREKHYLNLTFNDCEFWQIDLTNTILNDCIFRNCRFSEILLGGGTNFNNTVFFDCSLRTLEDNGKNIFNPIEIDRLIENMGGKIEHTEKEIEQPTFERHISENALIAIDKIVRHSQHACDISIEEISKYLPDIDKLVKIGIESGVFKKQDKTTSGPKKQFFRFQVDRQILLRGQVEITGDVRIDKFWAEVENKFHD